MEIAKLLLVSMSNELLFCLGVKGLIKNKSGDVLVLTVTHENGRSYYDLPGGRMRDGETPEQALLREIEEETALKNIVIEKKIGFELSDKKLVIEGKTVGLIFLIYQCSVLEPNELQLEDGIKADWKSLPVAQELLRETFPLIS